MIGQMILDLCQSFTLIMLAIVYTRLHLRCKKLKQTVIRHDKVLWTHRSHIERLTGEIEEGK